MTPIETPTRAKGAPAIPSLDELEPLFPQYELLGCIGRGGMGAVYRARHLRLEREVAIKVLLPDLEEDPEFAERFEREARTLARLNHPGIVGIHDLGQAGDTFYLVMEYVDGLSLRELLEGGRLSAVEALQLAPQICDALQYAHDAGVVHRDVKPENILIDPDGRARIADFGLVKLVGKGRTSISLTRTDQVMGTPHYMAPEQMGGARGVDHRADIYALGVVLYEMLTGELPLGRFAPPSQRSEAGESCDPVVLRALEPKPEERYQQAREVKRDLERCADAEKETERPCIKKATAARPKARGPAGLPWDILIIPSIVFLATFLSWGEFAYRFDGMGTVLDPRGPMRLEITAWNSHIFGVPNWLLFPLVLFTAALRAWRSFDGSPPRALIGALTAAGTFQAAYSFTTMSFLIDAATGGIGSLLAACAFGAWAAMELCGNGPNPRDSNKGHGVRMP